MSQFAALRGWLVTSRGDSSVDTTPVTLLERLRTPGDEEAWRRLVDLITPLLLGWSRRVGLSDDDAADLAQDVFTILTEQLPTFEYDPQRSFRAWLKTIAMNKWRERSRRPRVVSLDGTGMLADIPGPDPDATWENEYRYQLVVQTLQAIKDEFQPRTWQACWEVVARGRPTAEVAAELRMTAGALYAAKCRVLKRLRQEIEGMLE